MNFIIKCINSYKRHYAIKIISTFRRQRFLCRCTESLFTGDESRMGNILHPRCRTAFFTVFVRYTVRWLVGILNFTDIKLSLTLNLFPTETINHWCYEYNNGVIYP